MLQKNTGNWHFGTDTPIARGDARTATSLWALLVWAYRRELVRYAYGSHHDREAILDHKSTTATAVVCRSLEYGAIISGPTAVAAPMRVHPDAEWLHGLVMTLDRDEYWQTVKAAENEVPPDWNPYVPKARVKPWLKPNGRPRMMVDHNRNVIACRMILEGVPAEEREAIRIAARRRYAAWWRVLSAMRDKLLEEDALTRWRVTGIGLEPEPWLANVAKAC